MITPRYWTSEIASGIEKHALVILLLSGLIAYPRASMNEARVRLALLNSVPEKIESLKSALARSTLMKSESMISHSLTTIFRSVNSEKLQLRRRLFVKFMSTDSVLHCENTAPRILQLVKHTPRIFTSLRETRDKLHSVNEQFSNNEPEKFAWEKSHCLKWQRTNILQRIWFSIATISVNVSFSNSSAAKGNTRHSSCGESKRVCGTVDFIRNNWLCARVLLVFA